MTQAGVCGAGWRRAGVQRSQCRRSPSHSASATTPATGGQTRPAGWGYTESHSGMSELSTRKKTVPILLTHPGCTGNRFNLGYTCTDQTVTHLWGPTRWDNGTWALPRQRQTWAWRAASVSARRSRDRVLWPLGTLWLLSAEQQGYKGTPSPGASCPWTSNGTNTAVRLQRLFRAPSGY